MSNERKSTKRVFWIYGENPFSTGVLTEPQGKFVSDSINRTKICKPNQRAGYTEEIVLFTTALIEPQGKFMDF